MIEIEKDNGEKETILTGFQLIPVFCYEDTQDEAISYPETQIPEFPFFN